MFDCIELDTLYLKAGKYLISFIINSDSDLKVGLMIEPDADTEPTKIKYNSWYNEVSIEKHYLINFEITENKKYKFKLEIEKTTTNYLFKNYIITSHATNKIIFNSIEKINYLMLNKISENYNFSGTNGKYQYPLISNTFNADEIFNMCDFLLSGKQLTMGYYVEKFEKEFAEYVGSNYAVMVNSGSSANLLAVAAVCNYMYDGHLNDGDEVLVPTLCWSTTVWPLIQYNLKPVFVDVKTETMNIDEDLIEQKITSKTKAIMLVHTMGNCCDMNKLMAIAQKHNLIIIEDTCESLGSSFNNKKLGSFGSFGTYSFYYSHHITTIEGGMVVTNSKQHYDLLRCQRAHGWTRYFDTNIQNEYKEKFPNIDLRYMFINTGYNLRPIEMQAVMGSIQLTKLNSKNVNRIYNYTKITNMIINHPKNNGLLTFPTNIDNTYIAWFGLCFYVDKSIDKNKFIEHLEKNGIENRPIITGNFAKQPFFVIHDYGFDVNSYPNADYIHDRGIYIGLSCEKYEENEINKLVNVIFNF